MRERENICQEVLFFARYLLVTFGTASDIDSAFKWRDECGNMFGVEENT
jgi:hypothetical protein